MALKTAARAESATGRTYLDSVTALHRTSTHAEGSGAVLAAQLRDDLAAALEAAGWPIDRTALPR